ncbi:hypothetical protein BOTBODRAFT_117520, partial [Botryobasidium botryosum FD-172 SS1]
INAADSPLCTHCRAPETVEHYLLHCSRYNAQRSRLRTCLKRPLNSLHALLANSRGIHATVQYVRDTNRLKHYSPE